MITFLCSSSTACLSHARHWATRAQCGDHVTEQRPPDHHAPICRPPSTAHIHELRDAREGGEHACARGLCNRIGEREVAYNFNKVPLAPEAESSRVGVSEITTGGWALLGAAASATFRIASTPRPEYTTIRKESLMLKNTPPRYGILGPMSCGCEERRSAQPGGKQRYHIVTTPSAVFFTELIQLRSVDQGPSRLARYSLHHWRCVLVTPTVGTARARERRHGGTNLSKRAPAFELANSPRLIGIDQNSHAGRNRGGVRRSSPVPPTIRSRL